MAKRVVKINSNPNTVPAKGRPGADWSEHAWNSREGTDEYGRPTFDNKKKVDNIKVNSNPVPGKTRVGPLARGGAGLGGMLGRNLK